MASTGARYVVWCPDRGQEMADGHRIERFDARSAAEFYAENCAGFNGDPFELIELHVADVGTGRVLRVVVEVECVPNFVAGPMEEVEPTCLGET